MIVVVSQILFIADFRLGLGVWSLSERRMSTRILSSNLPLECVLFLFWRISPQSTTNLDSFLSSQQTLNFVSNLESADSSVLYYYTSR